MAIKRLHYFDHQFLVEADFTDEQTYHLDMRRRLNRLLYTFGIAEGLGVAKSANKTVTVRPGVALDRLGQEMIVEADQVVNLSDATRFPPNATVFITIAYQEQESDPTTATGVSGNTRVTEQPVVQAVTTAPPSDSMVIQLARFTLDASANVPGNLNDLFDGGVRQRVGPRGEQGLASLDGVSNPSGNVDLVPGTGIAITPDQTNRRITIAASGTQGLVSVDGVSNPGGNIDLVPAQAIVLTPDDANNRITIGENHSTLTTNPHNVTAAQIGALPVSDYDLRQRALATVQFTAADATNATRTVNVGFQPRLVLVVGTCTATMAARAYSGGVSAFADLEGSIQRCYGFGVTRTSNTDWFCRGFEGNGICLSTFFNQEVNPVQAENLAVNISNVSATGLTATLTRAVVNPANVVLPSFTISLSLLCMG